MTVYVIANQQDAIGKTTTAMTLASILSERCYRTLFADTIQSTLNEDVVVFAPLLYKSDKALYDDVEGLYSFQLILPNFKGCDYVVINTNPSIDAMLKSCLIACDEVTHPNHGQPLCPERLIPSA